ncbi:acetoacetate decarboxylase, partial [Streptomyces sp. NPDC056121]
MATTEKNTVKVDLGGRSVAVPKGGLYDRYRMKTDLDEVARDPQVSGVDFFRKLPKTTVESPIGPTLTPNFYYSISTARLTMLAPSRAIRTRLPAELAPLEVAPGLGLISVMFFRYDVCDIDFYTEAAVGVAVKPARHGRLGFFDLVSALKNEHLDTYVL